MAYAMAIFISLSLSIILVAPTICSLLVCKSGLGMGPILLLDSKLVILNAISIDRCKLCSIIFQQY